MPKKRNLLAIVSCILLTVTMITSLNHVSVKAKEKKAKFNKQYSGTLDGERTGTYILKVPADGTFSIQYSSSGDYTKVDVFSDYKNGGFLIPRIFTKNKKVKTKSTKVKKGDELRVDVYVQRPPLKAKYKIKFCYKKTKSKKSKTKIYGSSFSKSIKSSPWIKDIRIKNGKCKMKGSFVLYNKKFKVVKKYSSKTRTYKLAKNFNIYLLDTDGSYKVPKKEWNSQLKQLSESSLSMTFYVKNNKMTKMTFCP